MAWVAIPNKTGWEYDNAPPDPGATNPQKQALWAKSVAGVRTQPNGTEVYVRTRKAGSSQESGEISKTYWDNR